MPVSKDQKLYRRGDIGRMNSVVVHDKSSESQLETDSPKIIISGHEHSSIPAEAMNTAYGYRPSITNSSKGTSASGYNTSFSDDNISTISNSTRRGNVDTFTSRLNTSSVLDRLNDKVPSSKPTVDYQDKLWTQIDILDDVKRMSEQARREYEEELENEEIDDVHRNHLKALKQLKQSQLRLLDTMKSSKAVVDSNMDHHEIWECADIESLREKLFNRDYFQEVADSLKAVDIALDDVGTGLKLLDERRE
ncbi:hypothetical protein WICMUC_001607 [Wickerhamomyces mucosus]|uniref:Uncharacterized protein n=1 Tax=Wickerhamomyces mucosus TaxID=1378264 RepID=A0A9P8PTT1_9ASCO|nr:hypothetical protein WICMUC_001607 [Wickerhamomyces mucosus]